MLPRWLLGLVLICGIFSASLAMAHVNFPRPSADQTASHCAGDDDNHHVPTKQFHCMGACSGIEVGIARLTARMASPADIVPVPTMSSLKDVLLERDTPPPRPS